MIKQKGFIDPAVAVVTALVIIGAATLFVGGPVYNVWSQSLAGKAELQNHTIQRNAAAVTVGKLVQTP